MLKVGDIVQIKVKRLKHYEGVGIILRTDPLSYRLYEVYWFGIKKKDGWWMFHELKKIC